MGSGLDAAVGELDATNLTAHRTSPPTMMTRFELAPITPKGGTAEDVPPLADAARGLLGAMGA